MLNSSNSRKLISQSLKFFTFDNILYANIIREEDKAFSFDPNISESDLKKLKEYLRKFDEKYWNGYKNSGYLVILETGCPNNTIGCFWRKNKHIKPLWKRIHY